jgi:hypothetical protein
MLKKYLIGALFSVFFILACSTIENSVGRLVVKDYTAKSGQRVMAGQAEPRDEYSCQKLGQEKQDWGFKGTMDRVSAIERVTSVAVDTAPSKGANYVFVMAPSDTSIMGFNINTFKDAQVAYYKCANLPARK